MTPTARAINLMEFNPSLPYLKKIALDALNYFGSVKVFLKFSRPFWSEPNKLKVINYDSKTQPNGGTGISDDLLRIVSIKLIRMDSYSYHNIIIKMETVLLPANIESLLSAKQTCRP